MARTVNFKVEVIDGKVWCYIKPSCGNTSEVPINERLRWVLEQVNLGNWVVTRDSRGRTTSLTLGLAAAAAQNEMSVDDLAERARVRLASVSFAGIFCSSERRRH